MRVIARWTLFPTGQIHQHRRGPPPGRLERGIMVGAEQQGRNDGWFSSRRIAGSHHLGNAGQVLKWGLFTGEQAAKWTTQPTGTNTLPRPPNYETIRKAASIRQTSRTEVNLKRLLSPIRRLRREWVYLTKFGTTTPSIYRLEIRLQSDRTFGRPAKREGASGYDNEKG
jgi:hypothetical protein